MCNRIRASVAASVTVAAWLLSAAPAAADPVVGPPLGATKYASVVDGPDGDPDVDQYAVDLVAGEAMTLTVAAARNSPLLPDVSLVKPDGTVLSGTALPTVVTAGGKKVALKAFAVDESGRWGVRVGGKDGTEGAYTLASKFKAPKASSARGAIDPATA